MFDERLSTLEWALQVTRGPGGASLDDELVLEMASRAQILAMSDLLWPSSLLRQQLPVPLQEALLAAEAAAAGTDAGREAASFSFKARHTVPDSVLRFLLLRQTATISTDDRLIFQGGGVDALSDAEVRAACLERGVMLPLTGADGAAGVGRRAAAWPDAEVAGVLRTKLSLWLHMARVEKVPVALLLYSGALAGR